jgi:hypothetical protein
LRLTFILLLLACSPGAARAAETPLHVNESAARATVEGGRVVVSLPVGNASASDITARFKLELLDTNDWVRAVIERDETIRPGASTITARLEIPSALAETLADARDNLFWYRLRYQLAQGPTGIIALSRVAPDLFELNLIYPTVARQGEHYRARLRATHPLTGRAAAGVRVACSMEFSDDNPTLKTSALTGDDGSAFCQFDLPPHLKDHGAEIIARGERNGLVSEVSGNVAVDAYRRISLGTDKPIYQPGQTLHLRAVVFDPARRAVRGGALTVKITDPEETIIYRAVANTSRFGVASLDWPIPDNVRLGDYRIRCYLDNYEEWGSYPLRVRVSRYDLPNFTVNVKPDRTYYLPGQNAEVIVRGDYLFGQPLTRGHVRVVRETEREWNFREQKWEIEEEEKIEGELDQTGRFVARLDLKKAHDELARRNYGRFENVSYTAYITDPTTGRSEQRRFDLRVTKEAIHVYVVGESQTPDAPLTFYVTTFYADGTPAACDVAIHEAAESEGDQEKTGPLLLTAHTNRYGVAKVSRLTVPDATEPALRLIAHDRNGAGGHRSEDFSYYRSAGLHIETDHSVYHPGQPVQAVFRAAHSQATVFAGIMVNGRVMRWQQFAMRNGEAQVTFAYDKAFKGQVTIAGYVYDDENDWINARRSVLYPSDPGIKLDVKMSASSYRPGAQANAIFTVRGAGQRSTASALGVAVVDRAVQERARTDLESGSPYSFAHAIWQTSGDSGQLAGVTFDQLNKLAASSEPIPDDLDLVAEVLLHDKGWWLGLSEIGRKAPRWAFNNVIRAQTEPIKRALDQRFERAGEVVTNESELIAFLDQAGITWAATRDPWQQPYRAEFSVNGNQQELRLRSAGADKRFDSSDDFIAADMRWDYFKPLGRVIDRVLNDYTRRTGRFIRDRETLRTELLSAGTDINALTDRWAHPYEFRFGISDQYYTLQIVSGGPDRRPDGARQRSDDFTVWTVKQPYFDKQRAQVGEALAAYFEARDRFPQDEAELTRALTESRSARADVRDGWGRPLYATFKNASRYGDRVRFFTFAQYGEPARRKTEITPVTQFIKYVVLRSAGPDGRVGTADDFELANYSRVVADQAAGEPERKVTLQKIVNTGEAGIIAGDVLDPQGAVIPGAKVKATSNTTQRVYETASNDEGHFILRDLPPGVYEMRIESPGFATYILSEVPVQSLIVTELSVTLMVGTTAETVNVTGGDAPVQTETSKASFSTDGRRHLEVTPRAGAAARAAGVFSTPRLRDYFPETLVWQPAIETDKQGHASLRFKLADNITTWRLAVVASTLDGQISTAETDVLAFQPFFVEHDPPRVLTAGDEISLPVVVRNYLNRKQAVTLDLSPAAWFRLLGPPRQRAEVNAGDAARVTFDFRAAAPVNEGPQRVTAKSKEAGDAIEKRVTVHPDGEEITATASQVFGESVGLTASLPDSTIAGSARGELKIYPNLSAHVLEAIEAIMERPYGCAEQTISSAYPSLLALRLYQTQGDKVPPLTGRARKYVQAGYERLLNYRGATGGFSYWGRGDADVALTAYALQFLNDAARFISVDEEVMEKARQWLVKQQSADGSWPASRYRGDELRKSTLMLTAYVTRALTQTTDKAASKENADKKADKKADEQAPSRDAHVTRALDYLVHHTAEIDEPYMIAAYALAAAQAGESALAEQATARLRTLAHKEKDTAYWSLEANTPFYGWGRAGRIEATALAVQALASADATNSETQRQKDTELVNQGLLFLLREKDRYGVWYSTQATVQALAALSATLSGREADATGAADIAEVIVNGKRAATINLPGRDEIASPLTVDVSSYLATGGNHVEIRRAATAAQASAQLVTSHYEPWTNAAPAVEPPQPLRLKVTYDRTELRAGEEVTCHVEAERVGFRGYGMMLAEVGLPPGVDVDRASLDRAMTETGWDVDQYDVLPDRIILYLWPKAGGTRFAFKFKPRYGLKAQTAPSVLYDYYNPDARVVIAPTRFLVR